MISLIIASIDRSDFLINYIKCLDHQNFDGQLLIGDSSKKNHLIKIKNFLNKNKFNFDIDHYSMPNNLPHQCINKLSKKIRYDYSMWICDDDLLVLSTVKKCVNFLKKNSSFSAAGGKVLFVHIKNKSLTSVTDYPLENLNDSKSLNRIEKLSKNYQVVQYAISRTKEMKMRYNVNSHKFDKGIGAELYPTFYLAAMGKIKFFNDLFCVRQNHERRIILKSLNKIIDSKYYSKSVKILINNISAYIFKKENLNLQFVKKKMSDFFHVYEKQILNRSKLIKNKNQITFYIFSLFHGKNYFKIKYALKKKQLLKNRKNKKKFLILENFFTK